MKKLLCYLGILILLFLVALPPLLRAFLPDQVEDIPEIDNSRMLLSCSNQNFMTNTSYENGKIQMIVIKRLNTTSIDKNIDDDSINEDTDSNLLSENKTDNLNQDNLDDTNQETELDLAFDDLKTKGDITYNILDDGEVIGIDFSLSEHEKLNLTLITKPIEEQKVYYESQGLTCLIKK